MRLSNWLYQFSCRLTHTGHNSRRRGQAAGDGRRTGAGRRSQQPRTAELLEHRILPAVLVNTGASADELIFTLPDGAQAVLEAAVAGQTQLRSTNAAFDTTTFANPATSLTINYGGVLTTETLDVAGVDSGFDAALLIVNGGLNDEFTV